ncbi:MAG: hypothetical protein AAFO07_18550 [Bacteroidota bacterium]
MKAIKSRTLVFALLLCFLSTTMTSCWWLKGEGAEPECWTCNVDYPNGSTIREEVCNTQQEQAFKTEHQGYSPYCY